VADPPGAQRVERAVDARGPGELARVRSGDEPGVAGDGERLRERLRREERLVGGEPERHHTRPGVLGGELGQVDGLGHLEVAERGHDPPAPDAAGGGGALALVDDDLQHLVDGAELPGVAGRVEMRLHPDRAVVGGVVDHLADHAAQVFLGLDQRRCRAVLHPELAERRVAPDGGSGNPGLRCQLGERGRPHRALQVQMQVGLREVPEIAGHQMVDLPWKTASSTPVSMMRETSGSGETPAAA
jgi:hypothetical protein